MYSLPIHAEIILRGMQTNLLYRLHQLLPHSIEVLAAELCMPAATLKAYCTGARPERLSKQQLAVLEMLLADNITSGQQIMQDLVKTKPNRATTAKLLRRKPEPAKVQHLCWVYFMQAGDAIKIGYSTDPQSRLTSHKTSNPDAKFIACVPGSRTDEQSLHRKFVYHRLQGEWFRLVPEIVAYALRLQREFEATGAKSVHFLQEWSEHA